MQCGAPWGTIDCLVGVEDLLTTPFQDSAASMSLGSVWAANMAALRHENWDHGTNEFLL